MNLQYLYPRDADQYFANFQELLTVDRYLDYLELIQSGDPRAARWRGMEYPAAATGLLCKALILGVMESGNGKTALEYADAARYLFALEPEEERDSMLEGQEDAYMTIMSGLARTVSSGSPVFVQALLIWREGMTPDAGDLNLHILRSAEAALQGRDQEAEREAALAGSLFLAGAPFPGLVHDQLPKAAQDRYALLFHGVAALTGDHDFGFPLGQPAHELQRWERIRKGWFAGWVQRAAEMDGPPPDELDRQEIALLEALQRPQYHPGDDADLWREHGLELTGYVVGILRDRQLRAQPSQQVIVRNAAVTAGLVEDMQAIPPLFELLREENFTPLWSAAVEGVRRFGEHAYPEILGLLRQGKGFGQLTAALELLPPGSLEAEDLEEAAEKILAEPELYGVGAALLGLAKHDPYMALDAADTLNGRLEHDEALKPRAGDIATARRMIQAAVTGLQER
ncbi:MAG: hypothetical protein GMKNLPBB_02233 [Myxococcota bacterium]|nr:hypothetical protein [Myxococcota bacterium]